MPAERAPNPYDLSENDLYAQDAWREPYARLRAEAPLSWREDSPYGAYWSAATHEVLQQIELDHPRFSSDPQITIVDGIGPEGFPNFLAMDPPRHTELRRVFAEAFSPTQMAAREGEIRARTHALLDELPVGETFDWVERVSVALTIGMLAILFDFPWEERYDLKKWSDMATEFSPDIMTEERNMIFMAEMAKMMMKFDAMMEARRNQPPADDLLSRMVHSEATKNLNPIERLANIVLMIVAGNDTTRNSMSGMVLAFDQFPGELDKLRADRGLIPNAAQELFRWQTPVLHMRRTAKCDVEVAGQKIAAGEKVVMWYLSANRDESVFPDAERFDVARENARRHLAFGHGIHRCVGARLAELQTTVLIEEILDRGWRIVPQGPAERQPSAFLRTINALPVKIEAA